MNSNAIKAITEIQQFVETTSAIIKDGLYIHLMNNTKTVYDYLTDEQKTVVNEEIYQQVREQLMTDQDLIEEVKDELRESLEEEIKDELRESFEENIKEELRESLEEEVKDELLEELEEDIKDELREELKEKFEEEIKDRLRRELEYEVKQELRETIKYNEEDKIRREIIKDYREDWKTEHEAQIRHEIKLGIWATEKVEIIKKMEEIRILQMADKIRARGNPELEEKYRLEYCMFGDEFADN